MAFKPNNSEMWDVKGDRSVPLLVKFSPQVQSFFTRFLRQSVGEESIASSVNVDTIDAKTPMMKTVTGGYALGTAIVNSDGTQINDFGAPSTVCDYKSPGDFSAVYATGTTLTISGLPPFLSTLGSNGAGITHVRVIPLVGTAKVYINGSGGVTLKINAGGTTLTISGAGAAPFTTGDIYEVGINYKSAASLLSTKLEGLPPEYCSPWDGTVVWASGNTLTASGFPFTVEDTSCYIRSITWKTVGGLYYRLSNGDNGVNITSSAGTITVTGAGTPFASTDIYRVAISAQKKSYDSATDTDKVTVQNYPLQPVSATIGTLAGVTTLASYPSDDGIELGAYKEFSYQVVLSAAGTFTHYLEATNVDTPASTDWFSVHFMGTDLITGTTGAANTANVHGTNNSSIISFKGLNVKAVRVRGTGSSSTATGTITSRMAF